MSGVLWVIENRRILPFWPNTRYEVVTQPRQFNCWHDGYDQWPNSLDEQFSLALSLIEDLDQPGHPKFDPTYGATFYRSDEGLWTDGIYHLVATIGKLKFYTKELNGNASKTTKR